MDLKPSPCVIKLESMGLIVLPVIQEIGQNLITSLYGVSVEIGPAGKQIIFGQLASTLTVQ